MAKLAVSASEVEPVRPTAVDSATCSVAIFPSAFDALDSGYESGDRTSSWNTQAW